MELQNKFEEIIKDNSSCWTDTGTNKLGVEEATEYADYVCIEEVSKECAIICLEEQIKLLENIDNSHCGCATVNFKCIINQLQQQIKLLKK